MRTLRPEENLDGIITASGMLTTSIRATMASGLGRANPSPRSERSQQSAHASFLWMQQREPSKHPRHCQHPGLRLRSLLAVAAFVYRWPRASSTTTTTLTKVNGIVYRPGLLFFIKGCNLDCSPTEPIVPALSIPTVPIAP